MSEQSHSRKGRRIDEAINVEQTSSAPYGGRRIETDVDAEPIHDSSQVLEEPDLDAVLAPEPKRKGLKRIFLVFLLVLILVEGAYSIFEVMQTSWLLAGLYLIVVVLGLYWFGSFVFREYRALKQLSNQRTVQQEAKRLLGSMQIGEAKKWLRPLLRHHDPAQVTEFENSIKSHYTDREILILYQQTLLLAQDEQAKTIINQHAVASALLVALSPLALLDMIAVLYRGSMLVQKLSQHYGLMLGYRSRIKLYKLLFQQMVFAGATEIASDLAATAWGQGLLTKLSTRAAQGLSVGVFTARLGYKAMELCRPFPELDEKPNLLKSTIEQVYKTLSAREEDNVK